MITIQLNGEARTLAPQTSVEDLLTELGFQKGPVAVEVNRAIVPRSKHADTVFRERDQVEIVTAVGGG